MAVSLISKKKPIRLKKSISVFFPAYNDEGSIEKMVSDALQVLKKIATNYEVIVIDDASPDRSGEIADNLAKRFKQVKVVHHKKNKGYGGALKSGFKTASKELVFYTDGDGQYDVKEIVKLAPFIEDYDLINGFKIKRSDNFGRVLFGNAYQYGTKLFFGLKIKDVDCDFRLMKRKVVDSLNLESDTGLICVEMMKKVQNKGYRIKQVGVNHYSRISGSSQFFKPKRLAKVFAGWFTLWWKLVVMEKGKRR